MQDMNKGRSIDHVVLAVGDLDSARVVYDTLGFALTPRAFHNDAMGSSNHLIQFADKTFIEILTIDRPEKIANHDFSGTPPVFSPGAHNRERLIVRNGISMLAFVSDDARVDICHFKARGIPTYAPFDFERQARLADGSSQTVAFSLAFATSPDIPGTVFFVCQNRLPENFWQPRLGTHDNGASGIKQVYLASNAPEREARFIARMFGGSLAAVDDGFSVSCTDQQQILVLSEKGIKRLDEEFPFKADDHPAFAGLGISCTTSRKTVSSVDGLGVFIKWIEGWQAT